MEALEIKNNADDKMFLLKKLTNTINAYRARYPELGYITSGLNSIKKEGSTEGSLDILEKLDQYMFKSLFEYYVIKIIHHKFHDDVETIKADHPLNRSEEFYLDFSGFPEITPVKESL